MAIICPEAREKFFSTLRLLARDNVSVKLKGDEPSLAAYWNFNDGAGLLAADLTSVDNDLLLRGAPRWIASSAMGTLEQITVVTDEDTPVTLTLTRTLLRAWSSNVSWCGV